MKILITGSEGLLGKLTQECLVNEGHEIIGIDIKGNPPIDLLDYDKLLSYFNDINSVFHFAAHPRPWITPREAKENINITYNVLEACRVSRVGRIVYASSINVYNMEKLYGKKIINESTPIHPNPKTNWKVKEGGKFYPMSKVVCESMVKSYNQLFDIDAISLRLGCVTPYDKPYTNEPEDFAIWLSHEDFKEIIKRAINFKGYAEVICVSNNDEHFVDLSHLNKVLGYMPKSNSSNYKK